MNSVRLYVDTTVWQRSLAINAHSIYPAALREISIGMAPPVRGIYLAVSYAKRWLMIACAGYTKSLATIMGFHSQSL